MCAIGEIKSYKAPDKDSTMAEYFKKFSHFLNLVYKTVGLHRTVYINIHTHTEEKQSSKVRGSYKSYEPHHMKILMRIIFNCIYNKYKHTHNIVSER